MIFRHILIISDLEYKTDIHNLYVLLHSEHKTENTGMTSVTAYAVPVYLLEFRCKYVPDFSTALMKPFMAFGAHNHEVPIVR